MLRYPHHDGLFHSFSLVIHSPGEKRCNPLLDDSNPLTIPSGGSGNDDDPVGIPGPLIGPAGYQGQPFVSGRHDPLGVLLTHFQWHARFLQDVLLCDVVDVGYAARVQCNLVAWLEVYYVAEDLALDVVVPRQDDILIVARHGGVHVPACSPRGDDPLGDHRLVACHHIPAHRNHLGIEFDRWGHDASWRLF